MKNYLPYGAVTVSDCARELKRVFGFVLCILFFLSNASAQFQHRVYYGWITDLASEGRPNDPWPSTRIDDKLLNDYDVNLKFMHEIGLNEIVIWGLFISREWPLDLKDAIDETRRKQVLAIIDKAHQYNIKVLSGMGNDDRYFHQQTISSRCDRHLLYKFFFAGHVSAMLQ